MTRRAGTPGGTAPVSLHAERGALAQLGVLTLVGVAYYLGARLGLSFSLVEENVTPLWPPTGIALASFLLLGRSTWPAVALGALAVNLPISTGLLPAAVTAAGNTLAPVAAVAMLQRVGFHRQLDRQRDAVAIVSLGALASLVSATIGAAALALSRGMSLQDFAGALSVWWTGDTMGILVFAPFLLSLPLFRELPPWRRGNWVEAGVILVLGTVVIVWAAQSELHVFFLILPIVGWAAWRLQLRGAAPAALIASVVVTSSAARQLAPFEGQSIEEQMLTLNAFNMSVALTSFGLASLVTEKARAAAAITAAALELEERVGRRTAQLSEANARLRREIQERSEAQLQLSQEEARARREHEIAETVQRSLLPDRIPEIPGVAVAARYVPATSDVQVGGDWYDVIQLPGGLLGMAIGDVAGHGLPAAATMTQLRMAVRVYAHQDPSPESVMRGLHQLVAQLPVQDMVTLLYLVFDPATGALRFSNAGHPPALALTRSSRRARYLEDALTPPLGATSHGVFREATHELAPGETLLLYTDGLVERRGRSISEGLTRLRHAVERSSGGDLELLCDELLADLLEAHQVDDDVALVALRPELLAGRPLTLSLPAEARVLAQVRAALRRWMRESAVPPESANEILMACGEACANVVQHAYGATPGMMEVQARLVDGVLELTVRDRGEWRQSAARGGGWGLELMRAVMDDVDITQVADGTEVRMLRRLVRGEKR